MNPTHTHEFRGYEINELTVCSLERFVEAQQGPLYRPSEVVRTVPRRGQYQYLVGQFSV